MGFKTYKKVLSFVSLIGKKAKGMFGHLEIGKRVGELRYVRCGQPPLVHQLVRARMLRRLLSSFLVVLCRESSSFPIPPFESGGVKTVSVRLFFCTFRCYLVRSFISPSLLEAPWAELPQKIGCHIGERTNVALLAPGGK